MKTAALISFPAISLSRDNGTTLAQQVYAEIQKRIMQGALLPGARLPPSRELSRMLRVSRGLISRVYNQLLAEGYLEAQVGSGTIVSKNLPQVLKTRDRDSVQTNATSSLKSKQTSAKIPSQLLSMNEGIRETWSTFKPFRYGLPPVDIFPLEQWGRLTRRIIGRASTQLLRYGDGRGSYKLRSAIATHVASGRGIACTAEQIFVTSGSAHGIEICARMFIRPRDIVYVEDPGYRGAQHSFRLAESELVPLAVDQEGCTVPELKQLSTRSSKKRQQLLFVTPSHQFPLGYIMSLKRRLELVAWARKSGALIIEDDYSGEYRYQDTPFPALKAIDIEAPVIYVGTMSKALFPGLRMGFLILPAMYQKAFERLGTIMPASVSSIEQEVLAEFIESGAYARHIRRVRKVSSERRALLLKILDENISRNLRKKIKVSAEDSGMHIVVYLPKSFSDLKLAKQLAVQGVQVLPLSECYLGRAHLSGVVLHYAGYRNSQIKEAAHKFCELLKEFVVA